MNSCAPHPSETAKPAPWVAYSTGIAWGTIALFGGIIIGYAGLLLAIATQAIAPLGIIAISTILLYLSFTVVHEAGHGNIAHGVPEMRLVERALGWIASLPFLVIPFALFAKIHDYHHAHTNDAQRDPDYWVSGSPTLNAIGRAFFLPFKYISLTTTVFFRDPVIARTHASSLTYYMLTFTALMFLIWQGYFIEVLWAIVIPLFLASFVLAMLFDWIPHTPARQQGRYQNTRSYLFPGLQFLTLGQNYHHIHHLYPRVSWYRYGRVFQAIRPELERNNAPIEELFARAPRRLFTAPTALAPVAGDATHTLTLTVETVQPLTPDAVAITFANLNGKTLPYKAGQYITVTRRLRSETVTRCYSIFETPDSQRLSIGVKQVNDGTMSSYLNTQLHPGDTLTVAGPFGEFIFDPQVAGQTGVLTLIAGGSGITPILSILQTALGNCRTLRVQLLYANRSIVDMMFLLQLNQLALCYPDRFRVQYVFEQRHAGWEGPTGYITPELLTQWLLHDDNSVNGQFYVCGPSPMKQSVLNTLAALHVDRSSVFVEEFSQSTPPPEGERYQVDIWMANGENHSLEVAGNQTVLQVARQSGIPLPYACGVGQCGCCMMRVISGNSELASEETPGLLPGELAQGLTLTCQCQPRSNLTLKEGRSE